MADRHEMLIAWSQLAEAVRALDAAWPSLPRAESERALVLLGEAVDLLANAEHALFPLLGLRPPERPRRNDEGTAAGQPESGRGAFGVTAPAEDGARGAARKAGGRGAGAP